MTRWGLYLAKVALNVHAISLALCNNSIIFPLSVCLWVEHVGWWLAEATIVENNCDGAIDNCVVP